MRQNITTPRPQPGYLNWLEKQSMLRQAPDLISQVSQTERLWLNNSLQERSDILLAEAPTWLAITPHTQRSGFFRQIEYIIPEIVNLGIKGIYLGEMGENLDIWLEAAQSDSAGYKRGASLNPDSVLGDRREWEDLCENAEKSHLQMGGALLPAATGRGPDFILQARNAPGHQGLYAMLEVPPEFIADLPVLDNSWDCVPLSNQMVNELASKGLIPKNLLRDNLNWLNSGGWAVTGAVTGLDGHPRRWLYRYAKDSSQPVLLWHDPSQAARAIFSASIIRHTGLDGQTLAGLALDAFIGLEPATEIPVSGTARLAPALEAVNELAAQIHRYGGWAVEVDALSPEAMTAILDGPCDFCQDAITPALVAYALITKDARPLGHLYKKWLDVKLPQTRLARGLDCWRYIEPAILRSLPKGEDLYNNFMVSAPFLKNKKFDLYTWDQRFTQSDAEKNKGKVADLLLLMRLGIPGLAFIDAGVNISQELNDGFINSRSLRTLLSNRNEYKLAQGNLFWVSNPSSKTVAIGTKLAKNNFWLLICNFTTDKENLNIDLPETAKTARDAVSGENLGQWLHSGGRIFRLALDGLQALNVIFYVD